jgi:predicted N-acetyltransferase YhbS
MAQQLSVRETTEADRAAVIDVVRRAFTDDSRDGHEETDIVEATWALGAAAQPIDLVAADAAVVGHVLGAAGTIGSTQLLGAAPLCVAPEHQGRGIGSSLMTQLLTQASRARWPAVVLLGDPGYYERFGFEPARDLDIHYEPVGAGNPHFLARRLGAEPLPTGMFTYCWEQAPA